MAMTVFCPMSKEHGECQSPAQCANGLICLHLKKMIDEAKAEANEHDGDSREE